METRRCISCMREITETNCPHCGYPMVNPNDPHQLPVGTRLAQRYELGKVLGQGGFGITYLAWDLQNQEKVAVKEFYPRNTVNRDCAHTHTVQCNTAQMVPHYKTSQERFLREARALSRFRGNSVVVEMRDFLEANNTAYIVMEFIQGMDLAHYVQRRGGKLSVDETMRILRPIMEALVLIHKEGIVHRDISPDNIILHPMGGAKLLDFGAVRSVRDPDAEKALTQSTEAILKHGFAPIEQYQARGSLGPWTDEYALCATVWYCLTGTIFEDATTRMAEDLDPDWTSIPGLTARQCHALAKGSSARAKDRYPNMEGLIRDLFPESKPEPKPEPTPEPKPEPKPEPPKPQPPKPEPPSKPIKPPVKKEKKAGSPLKKILPIAAAAVAVIAAVILLARPKAAPQPSAGGRPVETTAPAAATEAATEAPTEAPTIPPREYTVDAYGLPRNETLYFGGQQWGTVASWNPIGTNQNNSMAISGDASGYNTLMFETLFMYNSLDGALHGLLANDNYRWNEDMTELTVTIKNAARWCDGTPVTAHDVARTFSIGMEIGNGVKTGYSAYIADVVALDDATVVIKACTTEDGAPVNPLKLLDYLTGVPVAQAAWIDTLYNRCGGDAMAILNDPAEDVVWSGPYSRYYDDENRVVLIRDDNYWGQDASMWGKLPVPKYLVHCMYPDNAATAEAFKAGEIDVTQQFIANVQDLWEREGLPISTYYSEAPYGLCTTAPTAWYNMNIPVLRDVPAVRKAIAMAVDYDAINAISMTYQSPSFQDFPVSMMNPTAGEQALYDQSAVSHLQWTGNDIAGAIALLNEAGIIDTNGNGWREYQGYDISLTAVCPNGWTDWQAAMEIVAAAGSAIGINIITFYPEAGQYYTVFPDPNQTEYCIFMMSPNAAAPSSPYARVAQYLSSEFVGIPNNYSGNFGQYVNEEADAILAQIPQTTDQAELVKLYTRLNEIYLTEVPSFPLMYRPSMFHIVNSSIWTNFPSAADGRNIPPTLCIYGYGIAALYELKLS